MVTQTIEKPDIKLIPIVELLRDVRIDPDNSKVTQIFEILRELIVSLKLLPGQQISELEVAEAFLTSKTPVREALIRLEEIGLVHIVPKSGTYVTPVRVDRFLEACFIRLNLEIGAVRKAAQRAHFAPDITRATLRGILAAQEKALEESDFVAFFELDEDLHRAFYELAGVAGVWKTVKGLQSDVIRVRHLKRLYNIRRGPHVINQHIAIIEAIERGNPADAEAALVAHIGSLGQEIESLSRQPGLIEHIETLNNAAARLQGQRK
ncbi:GntR family transcriptional regulator [Martelella sp. HB161492]|uniref:GntR family transcriptional regulator n=1 Tax=Martelella sp. HB161492 TaxID=2720726 RepID=UPI001592A488|nr:GntR family transcriptional regulator [Martelella sp. HB161492]